MKLLHTAAVLLIGLLASANSLAAPASVQEATFGKLPDGSSVEIYTLRNPNIEMKVMSFGACVVSIKMPDRNGDMGEVVLGYDNFDAYYKDARTHFGVVPGRFANRIAKGKFTLDGQTYQLSVNSGENTIHGGKFGFDRHNWNSREVPNGVEFTLVSPDGDQGFPGTLTAHVRYTLNGNTIRIEYSATTDKPTVVNLTNHTYFNLKGDGQGDVLSTQVKIDADQFTPVTSGLIPTGQLAPVAGTPLDFNKPEAIGARIDSDFPQLKLAGGYDHNYVIRGKAGVLRPAAEAFDPATGRTLRVQTTQPGMQFYTANHLDGTFTGRTGAKYVARSGFCFETQHFPNSPNQPSFPSTVLRPGQKFDNVTTWTFGVRK